MGVMGVSGLDRLYSFMLADEIQQFSVEFKRNFYGITDWLQLFDSCKEELTERRIIGKLESLKTRLDLFDLI